MQFGSFLVGNNGNGHSTQSWWNPVFQWKYVWWSLNGCICHHIMILTLCTSIPRDAVLPGVCRSSDMSLLMITTPPTSLGEARAMGSTSILTYILSPWFATSWPQLEAVITGILYTLSCLGMLAAASVEPIRSGQMIIMSLLTTVALILLSPQQAAAIPLVNPIATILWLYHVNKLPSMSSKRLPVKWYYSPHVVLLAPVPFTMLPYMANVHRFTGILPWLGIIELVLHWYLLRRLELWYQVLTLASYTLDETAIAVSFIDRYSHDCVPTSRHELIPAAQHVIAGARVLRLAGVTWRHLPFLDARDSECTVTQVAWELVASHYTRSIWLLGAYHNQRQRRYRASIITMITTSMSRRRCKKSSVVTNCALTAFIDDPLFDRQLLRIIFGLADWLPLPPPCPSSSSSPQWWSNRFMAATTTRAPLLYSNEPPSPSPMDDNGAPTPSSSSSSSNIRSEIVSTDNTNNTNGDTSSSQSSASSSAITSWYGSPHGWLQSHASFKCQHEDLSLIQSLYHDECLHHPRFITNYKDKDE